MKKIVIILAVAIYALGMIATQANKINFDFNLKTMLACGDCFEQDDRDIPI